MPKLLLCVLLLVARIPKDAIAPQKGPQEAFMTTSADIAIYGGAAGSGKTAALLIEPLRYAHVKNFDSIIFRRKFPEITTPGGVWDEARRVYGRIEPPNARPKFRGKPDFAAEFLGGAKLKFSHLEYEADCESHQGGQYCLIMFDELTTFTRYQFFFLLSRNRSTCGVRPYVRCTCNPDAGSWVKELIQWWIDPDEGYAIPERSGIIRYFTRKEDEIIWVDKDWKDPNDPRIGPKSITFIPGKVDDNKILMKADPQYKANLLALDKVRMERFLKGNWNIREEDGMFDPSLIKVISAPPKGLNWIRYWDRAATEKTEKNQNPDNTAGAKCALHNGILYIDDMEVFRANSAMNEKKIRRCAELDGRQVTIGIEQEPGSAGKDVIHHYKTNVLKEYVVIDDRPSGDKVDRCKPWCALSWHGKVQITENAAWNKKFLDEVALFPPQTKEIKKDQIDAVSGAYKLLTQNIRVIPEYKSYHYGNFDLTFGFKYCLLHLEKDFKVYAICCQWSDNERKLYIYDEISLFNPTVPLLIKELKEKSPGAIYYANDLFFPEGQNLAYQMAREGIMIQRNYRYELGAAVLIVNNMFKMGQINVHTKCIDTDRQLREWNAEKGKPQENNVGCCYALCVVVSDLRSQGKILPPPEHKPYSRDRVFIRQMSQQNLITPETTGYKQKTRSWLI